MHSLITDLIGHKWYANAALLSAVRQHEAAAGDQELRKLFHHILFSNRFWLLLTLGRHFDREKEARVPDGLDTLIASYRETEGVEATWLTECDETELARQLTTPRLPGRTFTVADAVMQAALHSQGHRAQAATRLRSLGGEPPTLDFILWVSRRPAAEWPGGRV